MTLTRGVQTPKTKRGADTRRRIVEVAQKSLASAGDGQLSLDKIAAEAGVAKTSIFWHFGSKDGLILEVFDQTIAGFATAFAQTRWSPGQTWQDMLDSLLTDLAKVLDDNEESTGALLAIVANSLNQEGPVQERIRAMLRDYSKWMSDHIPQPWGLDRDQVAVVLMSFLVGVVLQRRIDPERVDLGRTLRAIVPSLTAIARLVPS